MQHMNAERKSLKIVHKTSRFIGSALFTVVFVWLSFTLPLSTFLAISVLIMFFGIAVYFEGKAQGQLDNLKNSE